MKSCCPASKLRSMPENEVFLLRSWLKANAHKIRHILLVLLLMAVSFEIGMVVAITHNCRDFRSALWALYMFFEMKGS